MDKQTELNIYKEQLELILKDSKTAHGKDLVELTYTLPPVIRIIKSLEDKLGEE